MTILKNDTDNDNEKKKNWNKEYFNRTKETDKTYQSIQCVKTVINTVL